MRIKTFKITPLRLVLIVIVGVVLCIATYGDRDGDKPELFIPARGCLFKIETNNTPEFFEEVLVDERLRIIIDDKEYWIRVEKGGVK